MDLPDTPAVSAGHARFIITDLKRFTRFGESSQLLGDVATHGGNLTTFKIKFFNKTTKVIERQPPFSLPEAGS